MMIILLLNVWYNDKRMITAMQVMSGYIEQKRISCIPSNISDSFRLIGAFQG